MKNPNGTLRRISPKTQNIKMAPNRRIIKTHAVRPGDRAGVDVAMAPKCPEDLEAIDKEALLMMIDHSLLIEQGMM
jgi:hypothetical protein